MDITPILGYAGAAFAVAIPAIGSTLGVRTAGEVSHGAMAKVDEGHGKFIGILCGLAICLSAVFQGKVAATAILASTKKQEIFGKCFAAAGIVESFAIFALVAGLVMAGRLP